MARIKEVEIQFTQCRCTEATRICRAKVEYRRKASLHIKGRNQRRCIVHRVVYHPDARSDGKKVYRLDFRGDERGIVANSPALVTAVARTLIPVDVDARLQRHVVRHPMEKGAPERCTCKRRAIL